jgi:steroid delta-isomerase-like uncharacterized protein
MTHDENKTLVRRYWDALNRRDLDAAVALAADDLVNHAAVLEAQGAAGLRRIHQMVLKAMPDRTFTCEELIAEGDRVVCRVRVRGTQSGPFEMTRLTLPASGREMSTEQIHVFRVAEGKLAEQWQGRDDILMLRQLGHLPLPAAG